MKKVIQWMLVFLIVIGCFHYPVQAEEKIDVKGITYSYRTLTDETTGMLQVIQENESVLVDAEQLGELFGYDVILKEQYVAIVQKSELKLYDFYYDSDRVERYVYPAGMVKYEAPAETKMIDGKAWIPLGFAVLLMDSTMSIQEDRIVISEPQKTILSALSEVSKKNDEFIFNWTKDIGHKENEIIIKTLFGQATLFLNDLLKQDGATYAELIESMFHGNTIYEASYAKDMAMLFTVNADSELEKANGNITRMYQLLSPDGKLADCVHKADQEFQKTSELWKESYQAYGELVKENNQYVNQFNYSYNKWEKAFGNQMMLEDFSDTLDDIQKSLPEGVDKTLSSIDQLSTVIEFLMYRGEYQKQDEFSTEALKRFAESDTNDSSKAMKDGMMAQVKELEGNMAEYSVFRYLEEHAADILKNTIVNHTPLNNIVNAKTNLALFAWNLASSTIFKKSFASIDSFILATYGECYQASALLDLMAKRDLALANNTINEKQLIETAYAYYTYLKFCYITRETALRSLEGELVSEADLEPLKQQQRQINEEIAGYMAIFKQASEEELKDEAITAFGFLPSTNEKLLKEYDDTMLLNLFHTYQVKKDNIKLKPGVYVADANSMQLYNSDNGLASNIQVFVENVEGNKVTFWIECIVLDSNETIKTQKQTKQIMNDTIRFDWIDTKGNKGKGIMQYDDNLQFGMNQFQGILLKMESDQPLSFNNPIAEPELYCRLNGANSYSIHDDQPKDDFRMLIGEWEIVYDSTNSYNRNTKLIFDEDTNISVEIGGKARFADHLPCSLKIEDNQLVFHYDQNPIYVDYERSPYVLKIYDPKDHAKYIELTKIV